MAKLIGNQPNQVPTNGDLGDLAYQNKESVTIEGGNISLKDNDVLNFGDGSDLQIYHDGSNSYIKDAGAGDLIIQSSNELLMQSTNLDYYLYAQESGYVQLYYSGSAKLATTSTGIDVTGDITPSGGVYLGGTGSANYLEDYEEGTFTPSVITNGFTQSVSSTEATYTKVGRLVTITYVVSLSSAGYGSGYSRLGNLPFVSHGYGTASGYYGTGSISSNVIGNTHYVDGGGTSVYLYPSTSTSNSITWQGTFTYIAD